MAELKEELAMAKQIVKLEAEIAEKRKAGASQEVDKLEKRLLEVSTKKVAALEAEVRDLQGKAQKYEEVH